jgi:hypothetical protein
MHNGEDIMTTVDRVARRREMVTMNTMRKIPLQTECEHDIHLNDECADCLEAQGELMRMMAKHFKTYKPSDE